MQKYSVNQYTVSNILSWVQTKSIAIPEIQRPFVWDSTKVRDLIDSLYKGYPIGYVIAWKNPDVRLKDGGIGMGKKIIIDGQQRITSLRAAILGEPVIDDDYKEKRIVISFHPIEERFETFTPAIEKDSSWIPDISEYLKKDGGWFDVLSFYLEQNPDADKKAVEASFNKLIQVKNAPVGFIELEADLDIEVVTDIFVRINSKGVHLSQADFVMSKIASFDGDPDLGVNLRKCIDYFCHLARDPHFHKQIEENDLDFKDNPYYNHISWMKNENGDLYDPDYADVIRTSFTKQFKRGRLSDLVGLLSGRNFETRTFEESIVLESFENLSKGVMDFTNETNFKRFLMIINSAGFISRSLINSQNALNFAYALYMTLKDQKYPSDKIEMLVRKWFVMSVLTSRYSGSSESTIHTDIKDIAEKGVEKTLSEIEEAKLGQAFWDSELVQLLDRSLSNSPSLSVFFASQVRDGVRGFLSTDITVASLITHRGDVHHIFPKEYLKPKFSLRTQYNQLANYCLTQNEINIKIGKRSPKEYMQTVLEQCKTKKTVYGGITSIEELQKNLEDNAIPDTIFNLEVDDYEEFLRERRKLMAKRIKNYYDSLSSDSHIESVDLEKILSGGETNEVEFKPVFRATLDPDNTTRSIEFENAKTIAAFMNTDGGYLVIGVTDKGEPLGLNEDYKLVKGQRSDGFLIAFDDFVDKYFGKEHHQSVVPQIVELDKKDVCLVKVYKTSTPIFIQKEGKEEFFVRASASTRSLSPSEIAEYIKTHWG